MNVPRFLYLVGAVISAQGNSGIAANVTQEGNQHFYEQHGFRQENVTTYAQAYVGKARDKISGEKQFAPYDLLNEVDHAEVTNAEEASWKSFCNKNIVSQMEKMKKSDLLAAMTPAEASQFARELQRHIQLCLAPMKEILEYEEKNNEGYCEYRDKLAGNKHFFRETDKKYKMTLSEVQVLTSEDVRPGLCNRCLYFKAFVMNVSKKDFEYITLTANEEFSELYGKSWDLKRFARECAKPRIKTLEALGSDTITQTELAELEELKKLKKEAHRLYRLIYSDRHLIYDDDIRG